MKFRLALLLILIVSVAPIAPSFAAGDRFALVIGNAKYPDAEAPLKEPINDARDVADELKRDGFDVEAGENLTGDAMRRAFDRLYGKIKPGSVALIFFSGFGIQSTRQSYMIPVDAQIWTEAGCPPRRLQPGNGAGRNQQPRRRRQDRADRCLQAQSVRAPLPQLFRRPRAGDRAERNAGDVFGGAESRWSPTMAATTACSCRNCSRKSAFPT